MNTKKEFWGKCRIIFLSLCSSVKSGINYMQLILEANFPKLKTIRLGRYAAHAIICSTIFLFVILAFVIGSKSDKNGTVDNTNEIVDNTGHEDDLSKLKSPQDVFDAIWNGFYGLDFQNQAYNIAMLPVSQDTIYEQGDGRFARTIKLRLSVNDSIYNQWKKMAHSLLFNFAVPKSKATTGCWMAGRWFSFDKETTDILNEWISQKEKAESTPHLVVHVEGIDSTGNTIARASINLCDFTSAAKNQYTRNIPVSGNQFIPSKRQLHTNLLDHRPDKIFELGKITDFPNDEQSSYMDKVTLNGEECILETIPAPLEHGVASLATAPSLTDKEYVSKLVDPALFNLDHYIVDSTTRDGIVAKCTDEASANPLVFIESPFPHYKKGVKLSDVKVKFISCSSHVGENICHLRQVYLYWNFYRDNQGYTSKDEYECNQEWGECAARFHDLERETAAAIVDVKCHIEESAKLPKDKIAETDARKSRIFDACLEFEKVKNRAPRNLAELFASARLNEADSQDAWGHPFFYRLLFHNGKYFTFILSSVGPDGKYGTNDDL